MVIKGSVVLVNFPFTDLSQTKLRPAIILWIDPVGKDVVVCAVTSQKTNQLEAGEFLLSATDSDFLHTGLRITSKVKSTRLATLDRKLVMRKLGDLSHAQSAQLDAQLKQAFQLN